jgi:hypothetical protein
MWAKWALKMLTSAHKLQRVTLPLILLERYHKDSNEFLKHTVTGDKTCITIVNVENKE